ncbi:MAG: FHA domain-containing protein [Candidatus Aenigmatarchaeota archaeon]
MRNEDTPLFDELVEGNVVTIGRGEDRDVTLDERTKNSVSKVHATVTFCDGVLFIEDDGSTNGTLTPASRNRITTKTEIAYGHEVMLGNDVILVVSP